MAKRALREDTGTATATAGSDRPTLDPELLRRVVIERVTPAVDDGAFPIKRTPGEPVIVEADVFADGHDTLAAALLWRKRGEDGWREAPMAPLVNDRWQAQFTIEELAA